MDQPIEQRLLEIYLVDHWAAAGAGKGLARRLAAHTRRSGFGPALQRVAEQVSQDDDVLAQIRQAFGVGGGLADGALRGVAVAAERVGRLKPNGRIISRSPLTPLIECEGLMAGVEAKRRLWLALSEGVGDRPEMTPFDLGRLAERAESQLDVLRRFHRHAARTAFGQPVVLEQENVG